MVWRKLCLSLAAASALLATTSAAASPVLMPLPRSMTAGHGSLTIDGRFALRWRGCGETRFLDRAAARLQDDVQRQTEQIFDPARRVPLAVSCSTARRGADTGEGYKLVVAGDGIRIDADGPTGVVRAFATLRQLIGLSSVGTTLPATTIDDAPRFGWRGVMLDTVRHFATIETIKRQIDAMERVKLNVLHLHLSDDQGFRVESRRYPRLTAATNGQFYTQAQIRELIDYAADRGIRVVPEFDMPGHSRAIVTAYPEIGVTNKKTLTGLGDVALNPALPATYRFLTGLIGEMAALFPDPAFHIGGDEVAGNVWDDDPQVEALKAREKLADTRAVEAYFHHRVHAIVRRFGKTMIGWEEVASSGLPDDVIVQPWLTSNATADATARGYRTIVSAGYYFDLLMPAEFHYAIDPTSSSAAGLDPDHAAALRKLSPFLAAFVTDAMIAFPRPPLTPAQEKLILGGEAPLWSELVSDELVDHRLWPRAAVVAERFWSPASVRDTADMYRRVAVISDLLTVNGLLDQANPARMARRLAPGNAEPVETLLAIVGPVRNYAHDLRIKAALSGKAKAAGKEIVQPLNSLADAAPVDGLVARRFAADAELYAKSNRALAAALRAQLVHWRDNDVRFIAASTGHPMLEAARPTSAQIAALAAAGIAAIDAIEAGHKLDQGTVERARALLATLDAQEAASLRPSDAILKPQPPADLIVKIGPGIRTLVDTAAP